MLNQYAGSGRSVAYAQELHQKLTDKGVMSTIIPSPWPDSLKEFSEAWIVGGDGTINVFLNQYPDIGIPLMIHKGGSGNDFFDLLYHDANLDAMLEIGLKGATKRIDAGLCNGRIFVNGVGAGFEGWVAKTLISKNKKVGIAAYWWTVIRGIFTFKENYYELSGANVNYKGKALLLDIMNGYRAGGGFQIAPGNKPDDGLFCWVIMKPTGLVGRFINLPKVEKGIHFNSSNFIHGFGNVFTLSSNETIHYHTDGEYFQAQQLQITLTPGRYLFIC